MRKRRTSSMMYFLVFLFLSGAIYLMFRITGPGDTVTVPSLRGKGISEAVEILERKGLSLKVEGEEYDPDIPPRHVIRQGTREGEGIRKGTAVEVVISSENTGTVVPYLEGMHIEDVRLTLKELGMQVGKMTLVHSDMVEKDRVITQRPLPGYLGSDTVNLVVSSGPYDVSYKCPSFIQLTMGEALSVADTLGLKLITRGEGRVIVFQQPEAGAIVNKGDSIEVKLGQSGGFWF